MTWDDVPSCRGNIIVTLLNGAPTNYIPVHEPGVTLDGRVIRIADGIFSQAFGALVFWTARRHEFFFSYDCVARIENEGGRVAWENWDCKE